jgi:hypothetical protein
MTMGTAFEKERAAGAMNTECALRGHLWGDAYSFGGSAWHRDCLRCYESERVYAHAPERGAGGPHLRLVE